MRLIVLSAAAFAASLSAAEAQSINLVGIHIGLPMVTTTVGASTAAPVAAASSSAVAASVGTIPSVGGVPNIPAVPSTPPAPTARSGSVSTGTVAR
jgi:hypothetical protein